MSRKPRIQRSLLVIAVGVLAIAARAEEPAPDGGLTKAMANGIAMGLPGISVAIGKGDRVVWAGTAGYRDLKAGEAVRPEDKFGIGSITKSFVAAVVLQLAAEGRLDLDKVATDYVDLELLGKVPNAGKASLRSLLNHQSGIPTWEFSEEWIRKGRGSGMDLDHVWGKTETLEYVAGDDLQPDFAPGEKYDYSNTNYTLLGLVVEAVTGKDLTAEIRTRLLAPLGMKDSFMESFEEIPGGIVHHYHYPTPAFERVAGVHEKFPRIAPHLIESTAGNLSPEWAAGGMVCTAVDLLRWAQALNGGKFPGPDVREEMLAYHPPKTGSRDSFQYMQAICRMENFYQDKTFVGHSGGTLGFSAMMDWIEGTDITIVCLINVGTMHCDLGLSPPSVFFERSLVPAVMNYLEKEHAER